MQAAALFFARKHDIMNKKALPAQLYAPQADSAAAELLDDAAGHSELGAAFIDYNGTAYVVAVFR